MTCSRPSCQDQRFQSSSHPPLSLLIRLQSRYPTRSFLFRCGESEHWSNCHALTNLGSPRLFSSGTMRYVSAFPSTTPH